jgi:ribosome-associated toxin RatA of RatAB toxin-antitoxin module
MDVKNYDIITPIFNRFKLPAKTGVKFIEKLRMVGKKHIRERFETAVRLLNSSLIKFCLFRRSTVPVPVLI